MTTPAPSPSGSSSALSATNLQHQPQGLWTESGGGRPAFLNPHSHQPSMTFHRTSASSLTAGFSSGGKGTPHIIPRATSSLLSSSYAISSLDGHKSEPGGKGSSAYLPKLSKGDTVGMFFNRACKTISVTHNRQHISIAFSNVVDCQSLKGGSGAVGGGGGAVAMQSSASGMAMIDSWGGGNSSTAISDGMDYVWSDASSWGGMGTSMVSPGGKTRSAKQQGLVSISGPLCPVVGIKSGNAVLRFIAHGSSSGFFKNVDSLLYK